MEPSDFDRDTRMMLVEVKDLMKSGFEHLNLDIKELRASVTNHLMHSFTPTATVIISLLSGLLGISVGFIAKMITH